MELDRWRIDKSLSIVDLKPAAAQYLLQQVVRARRLDLGAIRERVRNNSTLAAMLEQMLTPPSLPAELRQHEDRRQAQIERRREDQDRWIEHLRTNATALRENRAAPHFLHRLARVYFGDFVDSEPSRRSRIEEHVGGDHELTDAILCGLRLAIHRNDVPEPAKVIDLLRNRQMHHLGWPFLAGLAEMERTGLLDCAAWTEDQKRKALAFYFAYPHGEYTPQWYLRLLETHPNVVAEVQVSLAAPRLRNRIQNGDTNLWHLANDSAHGPVARFSSLPLLRAFPIRCNREHLRDLDELLQAAFENAHRTEFAELIERKLSLNSMTPSQRAHWLAAGYAVSPARHAPQVEEFLQAGRRDERIRHFASFFSRCDSLILEQLGVPFATVLARVLAAHSTPLKETNLTAASNACHLARRLVDCLAANPTNEATDALASLCTDQTLEPWHPELSRASDEQRVLRRDHVYRRPAIEEVNRTLNNETPANAGDLAALLSDRLSQIATRIRSGNANDWRPYRNEDAYGRRSGPKHEESCRDALLEALRNLLPQGVDAQPEGRYANSARADIRVSCKDFNVPVELKTSRSRDLWSAPKAQLIDRYAGDPATDGYGLYVVIWSEDGLVQPSPSGSRPRTAEELEDRLERTLGIDERCRISICVIDVSNNKRPPSLRGKSMTTPTPS